MSLTHFPNGISSFGMPQLGSAELMTLGEVIFVDSGHTNASDPAVVDRWGRSADKPFNTIDAAIGACTANDGDIIIVAARHTEASTAAITMDIAGVWVYGLGWGDQRPTITSGNSTNAMTITAAGCRVSNLRFALGAVAATVAHAVNIATGGAGSIVEGCETVIHATSQFTNLITVTDAERVTIRHNMLLTLEAASATSGLNIDGSDEIHIHHNYIHGHFGEHAIDNTTADSVDECLNAYIHDNVVFNTSATANDMAIDLDDAATGICCDNYFCCAANALHGNVDPGDCHAFNNWVSDEVVETAIRTPAGTCD